jgi:hypothetical protein
LNLHSDLVLSSRNPSLVCDTPYIYGYLICERKIKILSCILKFKSGQDHHLLYLHVHNKKTDKSLNPHSDLNLGPRKLGLPRDTPYIYYYFICEREIEILSCILKFLSGQDHHLLYLYNIKMTKFEPQQWPWPKL